ncbi:MAG: hypothetical protein KAY77_04630, partial [Oscillospiraceae bacterium]|nr:hypothetical protein [Oscillospiraceae bacterium]
MDFPSFFSTFSTKSVQKRAKIGGEIKKFAPCGANFRFLIYFPSCLTWIRLIARAMRALAMACSC